MAKTYLAKKDHTHTASEIGAAAASHNHAASDITSGTLSSDRLPTVPVAKGGTGATTAAAALTNLGAAAASHNHAASAITSGTLAVARGGTGVTSNPSMLVDLASTTAASVFAASPRPGVTGTLPIANGGTGATSASAARTALGAAAASHNHSGETIKPVAIEFSGTSDSGGYLDFHFNGSTDDYTSRIIESEDGVLDIIGEYVAVNGKKVLVSANDTVTDFGYNTTDGFYATINGSKYKVPYGLNATGMLNSLGVTATETELNYVDGVTSNIQEQLNGKAASSHNHSAANITSGTLAIARGGTGATTAANALANLGGVPLSGRLNGFGFNDTNELHVNIDGTVYEVPFGYGRGDAVLANGTVPMTGALTINAATAELLLKPTGTSRYGDLLIGSGGALNIQNKLNGSNFQGVYINPETGVLANAVKIERIVSGSATY